MNVVPETLACDGTTDPYAETIALLQEEVARLEEELRLRDQHAWPPLAETTPAREIEAERQRLQTLSAELAERDEIIALLQEQIRLLEESRAADHAEFEQLNRLVEQLEERLDGPLDDTVAVLRRERDEARHAAEAARQARDSSEHAWNQQRHALEAEIERLRTRPPAHGATAAASERLAALEHENRQLARRCRELAAHAEAAEELAVLRLQYHEAQRRIDSLEHELGQTRDDLAREQAERQALLAAPRCPAAQPARDPETALTPNERLRALRLHLNEIQQREEQERRQRTLSARLARLWHRTGPSA